ncbi:hypothetical protein V6Z11_A06G076300 [Gossypium hirsutum]|uniref:Uncharacterized protein n=1 Tax=Gossypium tomentosum TaxID=34277 RepID=A0A5D2Q0W2_GOSTO|nr:hypothetical protein ES332_A06G078200v1 [Gossypium tomentosum]
MFKLAFDNEWHDAVKEIMDKENPIMLAFRSQAEEATSASFTYSIDMLLRCEAKETQLLQLNFSWRLL